MSNTRDQSTVAHHPLHTIRGFNFFSIKSHVLHRGFYIYEYRRHSNFDPYPAPTLPPSHSRVPLPPSRHPAPAPPSLHQHHRTTHRDSSPSLPSPSTREPSTAQFKSYPPIFFSAHILEELKQNESAPLIIFCVFFRVRNCSKFGLRSASSLQILFWVLPCLKFGGCGVEAPERSLKRGTLLAGLLLWSLNRLLLLRFLRYSLSYIPFSRSVVSKVVSMFCIVDEKPDWC
ncbi:hypothetical protein F2P56_016119 [Juglans regia]|uniref:Uncharacterized protein LOC109009297 n=2 Tax=Juglans regia TaxID=51240 RepID=A0A2I4GN08_JUGRE|nr:uncharacterized protein LOC109009297 [Juglans regia]KAF5466167.1 hypothetical protein F2P56_016119 [Juglans regia]